MNPTQGKHLRQRLVDGTDDERRLNERLAIGETSLVLAPAGMGPSPEFRQQWVLWQLDSGQLMDIAITLKRKEKSGCRQNVATIWRRKRYGIGGICGGYGLSDDGLWRDHTWGILRDGGLLETTEARVRYFGLVQVGEMADAFADMALGKITIEANEPGSTTGEKTNES
jgi:hypothetical protein